MFVTNILGHVMGAIKLQKLVLGVSSVNAVFNILLNLILIPIYADRGAAIATVATEVLGLGVLSLLVIKKFGLIFDRRRLTKLIVANLAIIPIVFMSSLLNVFLVILIAGALYVGALFGLKAISIEELVELKRLVFTRTPQPASVS